MVQVTRVEASADMVDPGFYRQYYKDMADQSDEQITLHWFKHGQIEGRFANEAAASAKFSDHPALPSDFDLDGYLKQNADVASTIKFKFQAIEHYLRLGLSENRRYKPKPANPAEAKESEAPKQLVDIVVDPDFYRGVYPDMKSATDEKCQEHYFKYGRREGRHSDFSALFNNHPNREQFPANFSVAAYIANNPDLHSKLEAPWQFVVHFLNSGLNERRSAKISTLSPRFIKEYYDIEIPETFTPDQTFALLKEKLESDLSDPIFMSAQELCGFHGLFGNEFLKIFDHEAYVYANHPLTDELDGSNHARCLEHFLTLGREHAPDISYSYFFDEYFYLREYSDALPKYFRNLNVDDLKNSTTQIRIDLFEHWLSEGLSHEMAPNLIVWAADQFEFDLPNRIIADLGVYEHLNKDIKDLRKPSKIFTHYINHGVAEDRPGVVYGDETAGFFTDIAEWLMIKGKRNEAVHIYNRILQFTPDFPKANHNLADELLRNMFHRDALRYYSKLIENQTASQWSYINASACYDSLSDDASAALVLKKGSSAFPDDINLKIRVTKAIDHYFPRILKRARNSAISIGIPAAQQMVRSGLSILPTNQFAPLNEKPIRHVTIVGNHDLQQCRFYRIDQKVEHLIKAGFQVTVYKHTENLEPYHARLAETDAVIFYRVPSLPKIANAINAANILGIPTFYDMDDLLFDEALFPPPLETYAGQITAEQHAAMAADVPMFGHAMSLCRFGIASTQALADEMKNFVWSKQIFHHKNAFGTLHERMAVSVPTRQNSGIVTLFYGSGTKAHKDDFHTIIEPVFLRLHEHYRDKIRFLVLGHLTMTDNLARLGDSLELLEPIWDIEDYWTLLRDRADINLSVLSSTRVTDAKSEIKWLEAAMFAIPSVVSRTATHEAVITNGQTGYLCDRPDEFVDAISQMIEKPDLRKKIGDQARDLALEEYSIAAMADNISGIMHSLDPSTDKKPKTKIAVVNVFYPPQALGGATRVVHDNISDLINEFGDQFEFCVFTSRNGERPYEVEDYVYDGVRVSAVSTENTIDLEKRLTDQQMAIAFRRFLDREKPDLVHFHCIQRLTTSVLTEARIRGIPYVITAHDGWWISDAQFLVDANDEIKLYHYDIATDSSEFKIGERQKAFRKDVLGAANILAVSEQFANIYRRAGLNHTIAIENGVSQLPTIARTKSKSGRVRLAHIGGMSRHKGFHLVRHALKARHDFANLELLVVDHARQKGSVAREMWGSTPVTLVPKVAQSDIARLFSEIDILLAPSIWPESYGLVTREALMCGCRVIASDRGAVGACVDHGENGLVVSVDTIDGVRDALAEVNANPEYYLSPPERKPDLRKSVQQARELAALYRALLTE